MDPARLIAEVRERVTRVRREVAGSDPGQCVEELREASELLAGVVEGLKEGGMAEGQRMELAASLGELAREIRLTEMLVAGASEMTAGLLDLRREQDPASYSAGGGQMVRQAGPVRAMYG